MNKEDSPVAENMDNKEMMEDVIEAEQEPEVVETEAAAEPSSEEAANDAAAEETVDAEAAEAQEEDPSQAERIAALTDLLQRTMAEFENYRRRTEKEKAQQFEMGARSVIEKFLPVVDNFERGFATVAEEQKEDPFVTGMSNVYRQLMTQLEGIDVKPIEAVGQPFNPDLHNAVMHVDDENFGDNEVVEEFQKGYTYRDSVIRFSMVKVAN